MGIEKKGQICVLIHSGSRGLGHQVRSPPSFFFTSLILTLSSPPFPSPSHSPSPLPTPPQQVATDALQLMEKAIATDKIELNDRQVCGVVKV
jgi:hypothetical protein